MSRRLSCRRAGTDRRVLTRKQRVKLSLFRAARPVLSDARIDAYYNRIDSRILQLKNILCPGVVAAGVDEYPYIDMENGVRLYGRFPQDREMSIYPCLPGEVTHVLPCDCIGMAFNVLSSYCMGHGTMKCYQPTCSDTIVEVGAYHGFSTMLYSQIVSSGMVLAIEALPDNFMLLKRNMSFNNVSNVTSCCCAIWRDESVVDFLMDGDHDMSNSIVLGRDVHGDKVTHLNAVPLRGVLLRNGIGHVDFLVLQVNGAEPEVLQGTDLSIVDNVCAAGCYCGEDALTSILQDGGFHTFTDTRRNVFGWRKK